MKTKRWCLAVLAVLPMGVGCGTNFFVFPAGQPLPGDLGGLTLSVRTRGLGTVHPGSGDYPAGTQVTLKATAASGWRFLRFEGDASGFSPLSTVSMDQSKSITAVFVQD